MTTEENSLLIHHKITYFINNLRGGERFLPHFTTPRINHGPVITQNFGKRKLTAVCSHQTRIGNLDAHLI
ncbi:MAG: hypothetical protein ACLSST_10595 [Bifidobacterium dentium]